MRILMLIFLTRQLLKLSCKINYKLDIHQSYKFYLWPTFYWLFLSQSLPDAVLPNRTNGLLLGTLRGAVQYAWNILLSKRSPSHSLHPSVRTELFSPSAPA